MDVLKTFAFGDARYDVHVVMRDGKPTFKASDVGKVLKLTNFRMSMEGFNEKERVVSSTSTLGGTQQATYLTERGMYKLLMRSRKPEAAPFQEWLCDVIDAINNTGQYVLDDEIEKMKQDAVAEATATTEATLKLKYESCQDSVRHDTMIVAFEGKDVVYVAKIIGVGDKTIIKIGSSNDVRRRSVEQRNKYKGGDFYVIQCYECDPTLDAKEKVKQMVLMERILQKHRDIKKLQHTGDIVGDARSTEAFMVTDDELQRVLHIARYYHRNQYCRKIDNPVEKRLKTIESNIDSSEPEDMDEDTNVASSSLEISSRALKVQQYSEESRGRRVQQYSTDGHTWIKTYNCMSDMLRDESLGVVSRFGVNSAITDHVAYIGHRWNYIDRECDPEMFVNIGETQPKVEVSVGALARLDAHEEKIDKAYCSRRDIADELGMASTGGRLYANIKAGLLVRGRKYIPLSKCTKEMIDEFVNSGGEIPHTRQNRMTDHRFIKIDPATGDVVATYNSLSEVTTKYRISYSTLYKAIDGGLQERGHLWKFQ
ncbi:hypothetical protein JKP88DRAFT_174796 [Tribonema minus]|uniref:Bro-N domain-containing protein n=1 Tax=Tribonema minus TaxID=303371 RepID=A0A835ZFJ4_9STRA|nr:hypothetical protein JKP88DRAFT_174796 [Tribonema minus]